jgi:DNA-binding protein Fis
VLASVGGNKAMAASILGIDRTTLHRKLNRLRGNRD